jgi:hypothetical protein
VEGEVLGLGLARLQPQRASPDVAQEDGHDRKDQEERRGHDGRDPAHHQRSRAERKPGHIAEQVVRRGAQRHALAIAGCGGGGEGGAIQPVAIGEFAREAGVEIAHRDVEKFAARHLLQPPGVGDDRFYADDRGMAVDRGEVDRAGRLGDGAQMGGRGIAKLGAQLGDERRGRAHDVAGIGDQGDASAVAHRIERCVGAIEHIGLVMAEIGAHPQAEVGVEPFNAGIPRLELPHRIVPHRYAFLVVGNAADALRQHGRHHAMLALEGEGVGLPSGEKHQRRNQRGRRRDHGKRGRDNLGDEPPTARVPGWM